MSADLKTELAIALLGLIHVITAILREYWARRREEQTRAAINRVQESLRPPPRVIRRPRSTDDTPND